MTKAVGMIVYVNPTTTTVYSTVCVTNVDGGGVTSNAELQEPCLADTIAYEQPGIPNYNQQTVEYKKVVGSSGISKTLEDAQLAQTLITYALKFPTTTAVYGSRTAYILSHTDMATERDQDLKCSMVLAPQSNWTYSTTAPTTS